MRPHPRRPDGVYRFEDFLDDCGPGTEPLRWRSRHVDGDGMSIDYEGSSPQTASGMNSYINYTRSYSYAAVKCLTDPTADERGRAAADHGEGARGLVPESAPAAAAARARSSAIARSSGHRALPPRCRRVAAAASHFANPTFGAGPRAPAPFVAYELVLSARAHGPPKTAASDVVRVQCVQHSRRGAGANQPIVVERFEFIATRPGRERFAAAAASGATCACWRRGQADESLRASAVCAVRLFGGRSGALATTVINPGRASSASTASNRASSPTAMSYPSSSRRGATAIRSSATRGGAGDVLTTTSRSRRARALRVVIVGERVDVEATRAARQRR